MIDLKKYETSISDVFADRELGIVDDINKLTKQITRYHSSVLDEAILYSMSDEQIKQFHSLMCLEIESRGLNKQ